MHAIAPKTKDLTMKMNTEELTATQIRLVKSIHSLLANVLVADEEGEYFEASAELMKKTAELIKHASFATENKNIAYGDQAIEYAVDTLSEEIDDHKIRNIDN